MVWGIRLEKGDYVFTLEALWGRRGKGGVEGRKKGTVVQNKEGDNLIIYLDEKCWLFWVQKLLNIKLTKIQ